MTSESLTYKPPSFIGDSLPTRFEWLTFDNILSEKVSLGIYIPAKERGEGIPIVDMGEIFGYDVITDSLEMGLVPITHNQSKSKLLNYNDLLFSRVSLVFEGAGKCSIYLGNSGTVTFEGSIIRARLDPLKADPIFYFHFFNSVYGRRVIETIVLQVAQAGIRASELNRLLVPVPEIAYQKRCSIILKNIMDYEESLNTSLNCINELVSTIFRSWFIDFDPVQAKVEGKLPYGMDEETAALFPDSFEDSELGPIPTGWNIGRIGDIADISSGKHQPERSELESSEYCTPLLGGAGIIAWTTESLFDEPIIVIGRVGTLGVVEKYTSPVWPSDNTLIFKTHHNSSFHYLLHQLRLQDFGAYNRGSTQPLLTQRDMRKLKILIPNEDILTAFEEKIRSMTLLSDISKDQSEILTKTRDTLLPRLMSGDLEVPMET